MTTDIREPATRTDYLRLWSDAHGGYDPGRNTLVARWLGLMHRLAQPLVRRGFAPGAVTLSGGVAAVLAMPAAAAGGRWLLAAAGLVLASAVFDGLDGAVAVMSGRVSSWGGVLDSVVDRIADGCFLVALWLVGAPVWAVVVGGALLMLSEYARARGAALGMADIGVVTVWERPTRVAVVVMFLLAGGLHVADAADWAAAAAYLGVAGGLVGLLQLLVVLRRRLA